MKSLPEVAAFVAHQENISSISCPLLPDVLQGKGQKGQVIFPL
jgi:hypothetical protein